MKEEAEMADGDHKGKRKKEWGANGKVKDVPKASTLIQADNQGNVTGIANNADLAVLLDWFYQWARDMHAWGQDVRDDIVRLEGHAGFATGDPGDPPDGPPGDS